MKYIEKSGKTVDDALREALKALGRTRDEVEVEVLEEGSKKMLGIIGGRDAVIRVTVIEKCADVAQEFLKKILSLMEIEAEVTVEEQEEFVKASITGDDIGILIGRRGETLDALQYLTGLAVNRRSAEKKKTNLDIENYRAKREDSLKKLANKVAGRVLKTRRSFKLEPMNPSERRVIHAELQRNRKIETYSVGEDPNRRVVVALKK